MSGWSQPCCERCWIENNTSWELGPDGIDQQTIRQPTRITDPQLELCCHCGYETIVGIYIRIDPATVPYPSAEADE